MVMQPLEQFVIQIILNFYGVILTNLLVYFGLVILIILVYFIYPLVIYKKIPNSLQLLVQDIYKFILSLFYQQTNNYTCLQYLPLILSIFVIILISNLLGLTPFGFTITSHLYITAFISISIFFGVTLLGFINNKFNFLKYFVPSGVSNKLLLYFLIGIEVISYIIRPLSLAIRLFANMLAGHTSLFILSGFAIQISQKKILFLIVIPIIVILLVFFLELAIAFIQAYVFTILLIIYINEIYNVNSH
jgi:ATP synthase subunit 6